jgi:glycosyltransferase involved in cell wall biosynthesis
LISPSIAAKLVGIPSIFHIHEIPNGNPIYSRFITAFLNVFPREIICVSKSVYDFWIINGLKKSKAKIIYNGFNIKKSKSKTLSNDKIVFTSISRIIPYKGHSLMIKIFEMLCKKNKNIYLQIIGDTLPEYQKYLNELNRDIKRRGLNNKIKFLGFRQDVTSILDKSNFFIHTPLSPDPLPTVIFEAINCKNPVITNNLGGAYEILNQGKNGLIIKNDKIDESVEKVLNYLKNQKKQKRNIKNAFEYVCKNFSREEFKRKILNTIE